MLRQLAAQNPLTDKFNISSQPQEDSFSTPNDFPMMERPHTELEVGAPGEPHRRIEKLRGRRS